VNEAFQFSSALSFITINGISALASSKISILSNIGYLYLGQGTCLATWGLTSSGMMTVNVIDSSNNTISANTSSILPLNTGTHIAQTFSPTIGNYLYINGILIASVNASTDRPIGPYTILGTSSAGTSYCKTGSIAMGQFYGSIDEYRVFGGALTSIDICRLANP
jgi:hypothetical protein